MSHSLRRRFQNEPTCFSFFATVQPQTRLSRSRPSPKTIHSQYHSCVSIERLSNYLCKDTNLESEAPRTRAHFFFFFFPACVRSVCLDTWTERRDAPFLTLSQCADDAEMMTCRTAGEASPTQLGGALKRCETDPKVFFSFLKRIRSSFLLVFFLFFFGAA